MKKITLIMITLIISISLTNASDITTTEIGITPTATTISTDSVGTSNEISDSSGATVDLKKEEFRKMRELERSKIEANKAKIKDNRQNFRAQIWTWALIKKPVLSDEVKAEVKKILDAHKVSADIIRLSVASWSLTKEEWFTQIEELRKTTYDSIKTLVGDNAEAIKILDMKENMLSQNMEIRKDNVQVRQDFRQQRQDLRVKYKEKFTKALWDRLDKMTDEKLEKVLTRIESAIKKTSANEKLSQTNKDKILAQLEALKSIINEKLWINEAAETLEVNVEELLAE